MDEQRYTVSFKVEGMISALSDIPDNSTELIEKTLRDGLLAGLEEDFEVEADWVIGHHFDVTVTARLES